MNRPAPSAPVIQTIDLRKAYQIGDRYFRLEIIGEGPREDGRTIIVQCDCGTVKQMSAGNWKKKVKSCGCYQKDTRNDCRPSSAKATGEAARRSVINSYQTNAKARGLCFELTEEQLDTLFQGACVYCDAPPSQVSKNRFGYGDFTYNGIDRLDSSVGYVHSNVVSCCFDCNRAKGSRSVEEFIAWIERVYRRTVVSVRKVAA